MTKLIGDILPDNRLGLYHQRIHLANIPSKYAAWGALSDSLWVIGRRPSLAGESVEQTDNALVAEPVSYVFRDVGDAYVSVEATSSLHGIREHDTTLSMVQYGDKPLAIEHSMTTGPDLVHAVERAAEEMLRSFFYAGTPYELPPEFVARHSPPLLLSLALNSETLFPGTKRTIDVTADNRPIGALDARAFVFEIIFRAVPSPGLHVALDGFATALTILPAAYIVQRNGLPCDTVLVLMLQITLTFVALEFLWILRYLAKSILYFFMKKKLLWLLLCTLRPTSAVTSMLPFIPLYQSRLWPDLTASHIHSNIRLTVELRRLCRRYECKEFKNAARDGLIGCVATCCGTAALIAVYALAIAYQDSVFGRDLLLDDNLKVLAGICGVFLTVVTVLLYMAQGATSHQQQFTALFAEALEHQQQHVLDVATDTLDNPQGEVRNRIVKSLKEIIQGFEKETEFASLQFGAAKIQVTPARFVSVGVFFVGGILFRLLSSGVTTASSIHSTPAPSVQP